MKALKKSKIRNTIQILLKLIRYNFKVIFANKFIYFLIAAIIMFLGLVAIQLFSPDAEISDTWVFEVLLFIGILLIFYPTVFGVQNDEDSRMLEIIFGIPNYRYKVWLLRLLMTFFLVAIMLFVLSLLCSFALVTIPIAEMVFQLMFPLLFIGSLAFMFSTIIRNGNGTAVVMVIIGVLLLIITGFIKQSQWNIFHNPFDLPNNINETIWREISIKNRITLICSVILFILFGLYNLQKREKFV